MGFESVHPATRPYAGFGMSRHVRRIHSSWTDAGWRSLVVQRFVHVPVVENLRMPTADVHLILAEAGRTRIEKRAYGRRFRSAWVPGWLGFYSPEQPTTCSYRAEEPLRSLQVHIPRRTVEQTAEQLGRAVDYERMAVSLEMPDPFLNEMIRAVDAAARSGVGELYAESAATFMSVHLLTRHSGHSVAPTPVCEDTRVRTAIAMMRDRLADPLTLADIADQVYLSVFHLVRVFKDATGQTPHQYLVRLRIEKAQHLLRNTDLSIAEIAPHCGFTSPGALSTAFLRYTGTRPSTYRNS